MVRYSSFKGKIENLSAWKLLNWLGSMHVCHGQQNDFYLKSSRLYDYY